MKKIFFLIFIFLPILWECTPERVTGTTDETMSGNKALGLVFNEDGSPAVGATVKIFQYGTTSIALKTETDSNGQYSFTGLNGTYTVLAKKSDLVSFQDSAFIFPNKNYLKTDTLRNPSSFTGQIGLFPGDNYQSVTAEILGTDVLSNIDAKGKLNLTELAEGTYRLKLSTSIPTYTTTYYSIQIERNADIVFPDTLWMIYTGIPTVNGLKAIYDTSKGAMKISWNTSHYFNFQDYILFRQDDFSKILSAKPLKILTDTLFVDTIFSKENKLTDTNTYHFQYRIKMRDKFDREGNIFGFIRANAPPPSLVKTIHHFSLPKNQSDTITRNDTILFTLDLENKTRNLKSLHWAVGKTDSIVKKINLDSTKKTATDTLSFSWATEGEINVYAISADNGGSTWIDSFQVHVVKDFPVVIARNDTLILTNSSVKLSAKAHTRMSPISKWEWDIGNTGKFIRVSSSDTTINAPSSEDSNYICIVRATNDDGWSSKDTVILQTKKIFITAPEENASVSGLFKVYGIADPSVSEIQVKLGDGDWSKATGISSWSAEIETRLIYPTQSVNISVRYNESDKTLLFKTLSVGVSNKDPLIGCWSGDATFCLFDSGNISGSPLGVGWNFPYGWVRNTPSEVTVLKQYMGNAEINVEWINYNTFKTSGATTNTFNRQ